MSDISQPDVVTGDRIDIPRGSYAILLCFFCAHAMFHFMAQSFSVMLPDVKNSFQITPIQVGTIMAAQNLASGFSSLPGGVLSDYLRGYRALLMAVCILVFGLGWLLISWSHLYGLVIVGAIILSVGASIWHLPSMAELGFQFAKHRGAALAVHGAGGSVGDVVGPVLTGLLLSAISWRNILSLYFVLPLIMTVWTYRSFSIIERSKSRSFPETSAAEKADFREQIALTKAVLKQTHIWRVNFVAGFRGMCFTVLVTFLPLIMKEQLEFSSEAIGFHFGLLWTLGILVSPLQGHFSDRWGRKLLLVPALLFSAVVLILLAFSGKGVLFTLCIGLLGLSVRSDYAIVSATILDLAGSRVATTILGFLSTTRFLMGAIAPIIAGALYQYSGMRATLFFVAILYTAAALIFSSVDMNKKADS